MSGASKCDACGAEGVPVTQTDWYDGPLYSCDNCRARHEAELNGSMDRGTDD